MTPIARVILRTAGGIVLLGLVAALALGLMDRGIATATWYTALLVGIPLAVVGLAIWAVEAIVGSTRSQE